MSDDDRLEEGLLVGNAEEQPTSSRNSTNSLVEDRTRSVKSEVDGSDQEPKTSQTLQEEEEEETDDISSVPKEVHSTEVYSSAILEDDEDEVTKKEENAAPSQDPRKEVNIGSNDESASKQQLKVTISADDVGTPASSSSGVLKNSSLRTEESVDLVNASTASMAAFTRQQTEASEMRDKVTDGVHRFFLYVSLPLAIISAILCVVLFSTTVLHASVVAHTFAGYCAFSSAILTSMLIYLHLTVYTNPKQQRLICRILFMVPIYAFDSWFALVEYRSATVIALIRDTYEAYVIYMFFNLLMDYLGGEERVLNLWATEKPDMRHLFPFGCILPHLKLVERTLRVWKVCLVQYMVINPLLTLLSIPFYYTGHYEEGVLEPTNAYLYFSFIRFVSVTLAFTSLVYFFFGTKEFMMEHKPLAKFAAIKTIVFLTFWQSVLLGILNHFGAIPHSAYWTSDQVSNGLNNFIICIEMFLIAIAHRWCFPDTPYRPVTGRRPLQCWSVKHVFSVRDVMEDTQQVLVEPVMSAAKETKDFVVEYGTSTKSRFLGSRTNTETSVNSQ